MAKIFGIIAQFLAMGGYAAYVWPAYAVAILFLIGMLTASLRSLRRREALLQALEAERPRRRRAARDAPAAAPAVDAVAHDGATMQGGRG